MSFQKPRGTNDLFYDAMDKFNFVSDSLKNVSKKYCFSQIETPIFEHLELFQKNIGESTDIIQKEIYNFEDKSGRKIALRPEGTAGVIRSYVENKIYGNKNTSTKFFYISKLFRYERPQNGRFREFHQFGVEYLGTSSFYDLIECIVFADSILKKFGLDNKYILKINNIGNFEERNKWIKKLKEYFNNNKMELSETSINRIDLNPLRIIDDKEDSKKNVVKNAPKISDFLSQEQKDNFFELQKSLLQLGIKYEVDESLVRGLDYYTNVVFEFISISNSLGKSTIIGGGVYQKLIKHIGGPDQTGIGFAIGLERLIHLLDEYNLFPNLGNKIEYLVATKSKKNELFALALSCKLRNLGICVDSIFEEIKPSKLNKYATNKKIKNIIWINDDSYENQKITLENLETNKKELLDLEEFITSIIGV